MDKLINYYIYVKYLFINIIYCVLAEKSINKNYIFIQQLFLVLESDWLRGVRYSSDIGTQTVSLRLQYFSRRVSWRMPKSTIIL